MRRSLQGWVVMTSRTKLGTWPSHGSAAFAIALQLRVHRCATRGVLDRQCSAGPVQQLPQPGLGIAQGVDTTCCSQATWYGAGIVALTPVFEPAAWHNPAVDEQEVSSCKRDSASC